MSGMNEYMFNRDSWMESARLSYQHHVYRQLYDGLLDEKIVSALSLSEPPARNPPVQICDLACGNGIWAMDVANDFPHTEVTGLDVSRNSFPPKAICPKNLSLDLVDILGDIPGKYIGKFDVVHIRLLLSALLKPGTKDIAIKNIIRLLKPGGYLHWQELCAPLWSPVDLSVDPPFFVEKMTPLQQALEDELKFFSSMKWASQLNELVGAHGDMEDISMTSMPLKKHLSRSFSELMMWTWEEGMPKLIGMLGTEEQKERLLAALKIECQHFREGQLGFYRGMLVMGRKVGSDTRR